MGERFLARGLTARPFRTQWSKRVIRPPASGGEERLLFLQICCSLAIAIQHTLSRETINNVPYVQPSCISNALHCEPVSLEAREVEGRYSLISATVEG